MSAGTVTARELRSSTTAAGFRVGGLSAFYFHAPVVFEFDGISKSWTQSGRYE